MITAKYECSYCEVEFVIIDDPAQIVCYCPYCGSNDIENIEEPGDDYTEKLSEESGNKTGRGTYPSDRIRC